jgi:hypothetical protein
MAEHILLQNFFHVVEATKSLCLKTQSPQKTLVLGHYLKQIALLKNNLGIVEGSMSAQTELQNFQTLYQKHWNSWVSSVAKCRQRLKQLKKAPTLPLTEDLLILLSFLKMNLKRKLTYKAQMILLGKRLPN